MEENDPFRHDVLRPTPLHLADEFRQSHRPQRVSMNGYLALEAPKLLKIDNLTLLGRQGEEALAVSLGDTVYLWKHGSIELLAQKRDCPFSCVQWSDDKKFLALGTDGGILIFCRQEDKIKPLFEFYDEHFGPVTAIAWKGTQIAFACSNGITRYDLQCEDPLQATYIAQGLHIIASVERNGNTIAAAANGQIKLWDSTKSGRNIQARRTMEHSGVKSLDIISRRPNVLVSSGDGGLKFWNTWFGKLRAEIAMKTSPTTTICSTERDEILVAHGNCLSLWTLGPSVQKVMEYCSGNGKILCLKRGLNGSIVCAHDNEMLTFHSFRRKMSKEKARAVLMTGLLQAPNLR